MILYGVNSDRNKEVKEFTPADSLLLCVSQIYKVYINDSLYQDLDYYFYKSQPYDQEGIKAIINLNHLARGKCSLRIDRLTHDFDEDTTELKPYASTPFWVE